MSDDRIDRLPRWARDLIAERDREITRQASIISELRGENPGIAVRDPYGDATPVAFDQHDGIRFALRGEFDHHGRDWIEIRRRRDGEVEVSGSGVLAVTPQVSNVITVTLR